jgi:surface carbohydrate biosynthesis protein
MNRRIGFIVDHPKRDLAGAAILAHALGKRGMETALIPLYDQAVDVPLLGLDALVVNFARPANRDLVGGYVSSGVPVWVLDTEGGILAENGGNSPATLAAYIRDSGWRDLVSGYFVWGSTLFDAFVRDSGLPIDRIHLTGCPRFDWASPRWRDLLLHDRRGYVLVNANFPLVNPRFSRSVDDELRAIMAAGWEQGYVEKMLVDSKSIFSGYLETISRVARALPEQAFLVRPHPFEDVAIYESTFAGLPNVTVDGRGSVLNVIKNASCVIHLNCGTAIEAVMLGRLPISMEYLNTEFMARHSRLPSQVSATARNVRELIEMIVGLDSAVDGFDFEGRHSRLVEPWFHLNDGRASDRIAEVLDRQTVGGGKGPISLRRSLASSRTRSRVGQLLQAALSNAFGSHRASVLRSGWQVSRRSKRFDESDVRDLMTSLSRCPTAAKGTVFRAQHPYFGVPLSSIIVGPH